MEQKRGALVNGRLEAAFLTKSKRTAPSRDRNRDLRITCIAAIPRSTTELKKLVLVIAGFMFTVYIAYHNSS
jgi:hypothetical protein